MLTIGEFAAALRGVRRLLRLKPDAFELFDATPRGFWKSFWVAAIILPVWALLVADQAGTNGQAASLRYFLVQGIGYVVSWLAYPLLMVRLADVLDRWPRYYSYMVAYNWFQLVQTLAWLPVVLLLDRDAPRGLIGLLWLTTHGVLLGYSWFIARRGLKVDTGAAIALVIIDLLLSLLIDRLTDAIV